jgi:alcohol dehydrogenase
MTDFDAEENVMKAFIYNGPGKKAVEARSKPEISAPTDAVVKLAKASAGPIFTF